MWESWWGDIGSAKDLVLSRDALLAEGLELHWFADPRGMAREKVLMPFGIVPEVFEGNTANGLDALLVGVSATAVDLQIRATKDAKMVGCPVLWYVDLHGTGSREVTRSVSPNVMLDIDRFAADISKRVRPDIESVVVGKPSFAGMQESLVRETARRDEVRASLGVGLDDVLIVLWSGGEDPAKVWMQLDVLVHLANRKLPTGRIMVAPRLHPKLPAQELTEMRELLSRHPNMCMNAQSVDSRALNIAADVVVTTWGSTEAIPASLFGVPVVINLSAAERVQCEKIGYLNGEPPLVAAGVAHAVGTEMELIGTLLDIARDPEKARKRPKDNIGPFSVLLREGAPERIARAVVDHLR